MLIQLVQWLLPFNTFVPKTSYFISFYNYAIFLSRIRLLFVKKYVHVPVTLQKLSQTSHGFLCV